MTELPAPLDVSVFRRMADMSNEAFYLIDAHGRFRYVNQRALTLSGYTWEELRQLTTTDIAPDYSLHDYVLGLDALAAGPLPLIETRTRRKDGSFVPVEVSVALLAARGERYVFGVVRDISVRKQIEHAHRTFAHRLVQTLEAERRRVARELHDDVGRALSDVDALVAALERGRGARRAGRRPALAATLSTIRTITESVARIVRDHHAGEIPGRGLDGGLEDALRTHARAFAERHGLALRLATERVEDVLDGERALHLYRIAQEALANVARHARAARVFVRLRRDDGHVVLTVRDDGVGIGAEPAARTGFGLVTMRERAELMGARLGVRRLRRGGTEVRVAAPVADAPRGGGARAQPRRAAVPSRARSIAARARP